MPERKEVRYAPETIAYAASRDIAQNELPLIVNGCSGGLSKLYALGGKSISCEDCCNMHDIDYQIGGTPKERREADRRLRQCAGRAGNFPPGVTGRMRRLWRGVRAWVMWACVRLLGWPFWAG